MTSRPFRPEDVDLADLATTLKNAFPTPPVGFIVGRTVLRDAVATELSCSLSDAEQVTDTMVSRGFLRYEGDSKGAVDEGHPWMILPTP